jgi:hypothetical protein
MVLQNNVKLMQEKAAIANRSERPRSRMVVLRQFSDNMRVDLAHWQLVSWGARVLCVWDQLLRDDHS